MLSLASLVVTFVVFVSHLTNSVSKSAVSFLHHYPNKRYKLIILLMFHYQLRHKLYRVSHYLLSHVRLFYYILNKSITISKLNNMYQIRPAVHTRDPKTMKLYEPTRQMMYNYLSNGSYICHEPQMWTVMQTVVREQRVLATAYDHISVIRHRIKATIRFLNHSF